MPEIKLYRGCQIGRQIPAYDVEDTYLDAQDPNTSHGGFYSLTGGPDKTILIRFGDIQRATGFHVYIVNASLVFTNSSDALPSLKQISQVLKPWGEGPAVTLGNTFSLTVPNAKPVAPAAPYEAATWTNFHQGAKSATWQTPGALGPFDSIPISSAKTHFANGEFTIDGLTAAVQKMVDSPGDNFGFALQFNNAVDFDSSEAKNGRPELIVDYQLLPNSTNFNGLSVQSIEPTGGDSYTATIVNQSDSTQPSFLCQWTLDDVPSGQPISIPALTKGTTTAVQFRGKIPASKDDHRVGKLSLQLESAADQSFIGNPLSVYTNGEPIAFNVSLGSSDRTNLQSSHGRGLNAWLLSQIDACNNLVFSRSRFSFAISGCLERVRMASPGPDQNNADSIQITTDDMQEGSVSSSVIKKILLHLGAEDLGSLEFMPADSRAKIAGYTGGGISWFPGITGGGDIRFDGSIPPSFQISEQATENPIAQKTPVEPIGPLSATNVGILNGLVGKEGDKRAETRTELVGLYPATIFVQSFHIDGSPLKNATLSFYPYDGKSVSLTPEYQLKTGATDSVILPTGNPKKPDPFTTGSPVDPRAFLVKCTVGTESAFSWIKDWQFHDAFFRGNSGLAFIAVRFNLASDLVDRSEDLASEKAIKDSQNDSASVLAPLVDTGDSPLIFKPSAAPQWVEIDLNRDRPIAEVQITLDPKNFWQHFEIETYGTGQSSDQVTTWTVEPDLAWTLINQGFNGTSQTATLVYHGPTTVARFIRIVSLDGGSASISKISVFAAAPNPAATGILLPKTDTS